MKTQFLLLIGLMLFGAQLSFAQSLTVAEPRRAHRIQLSGVRGQSILESCYHAFPEGSICLTDPYPTSIIVRNVAGRYVTTIQTDAQGRFQTRLRPGRYTLIPQVNITTNPDGVVAVTFPYANPVRVVVPNGRFIPVTVTYRGPFF